MKCIEYVCNDWLNNSLPEVQTRLPDCPRNHGQRNFEQTRFVDLSTSFDYLIENSEDQFDILFTINYYKMDNPAYTAREIFSQKLNQVIK